MQVKRIKKRGYLAGLILLVLCMASSTALQSVEAAGRQEVSGALIRISSGNGAVAGEFGADTDASGGQAYANAMPIDRSTANAAPEAVYQHELYGEDFSYVIPAPKPPSGRSYTVRLHFAELYDTGPDRRVMDVAINGEPSHAVTVLEGIRTKLGPGATVGYERGCDIKGASKAGFEAAVGLAQRSDVVVAVLGLNQSVEGEEGEGGDRTEIGLPGVQEDLLEALAGTGKPIVLVLLNGSAIALNWADAHIPGIVEAWYPGEEGGTAVADVLFGDYNPAGRLPITFYHSTADLPPFTDYAMKNRTYRYYTGSPLYGFGYGLSYTQFQYSDPHPPIRSGKSFTVTTTVRNTGKRAGEEVVELYLRPTGAQPDQTLPRLILSGFKRIVLQPGESKKVTFTLSPQQLLLVDKNGERTVKPAKWEVFVGSSQPEVAPDGTVHPGDVKQAAFTP